MAYERTQKKQLGSSLNVFIESLSENLRNQITSRNAEDELKFNKSVLENNISLDEQIAYRQEQLKRLDDLPEEKARLRKEISGLKARIEQKGFSDQYTDQLLSLSTGASSIENVISWLEVQKESATSQTIIDSINSQLVEANKKKFDYSKTMIDNQTEFAIKDKSERVLTDQINKVTLAKNKALLSGDATLASNYDLQLQSLQKAKTENGIAKITRDLAVSTITGNYGAVDLLDSYNSQIQSASNTGAITINGTTYASEREYWAFARDSYIADQSSSGFFNRISAEVDTDLKLKNSKNLLDTKTVEKAAQIYNKLATRNELQGFESQIEIYKQSTLQGGADMVSDSIINKYSNDYDVNKALNDFKTLENLGVNVSSSVSKVVSQNAAIKEDPTKSIIVEAYNIMSTNPGISINDAVSQAIQKGSGIILSPKDLAEKKTKDIAKDTMTTAEEGTGIEDPRLTVNPTPVTPAPGAPTQAPASSPTYGASYSGGSIVDFLNTNKQASDFTSRAKLAADNGITNYIGSAEQNTKLLGLLKTKTNPAPTPTTPTGSSTPTSNNQNTKPKANPTPTPTPTPKPQPTPTPKPQPKPVYQGNSIVDYLSSVGQSTSYSDRAKLAAKKGIQNYSGTAAQNTALLKKLRGF
jgi:hypothetical protein